MALVKRNLYHYSCTYGIVDDVLLFDVASPPPQTGDNESMVSAASSVNEDPLNHHSSALKQQQQSQQHMKHEFAEEKLPLKDNNNPYQNIYGKWERIRD